MFTFIHRRAPLSSGQIKNACVITLSLLLLVGIFYFSRVNTADDWETFFGASRLIMSGHSPYGEKITISYYSNPPWLAIVLAPIAVLPFHLGWSVLCVANMLAVLLISRRWQLGLVKMIMALTSPAMFYIMLHGQIDALIIAGICLPFNFWPLVALAKPQVAIGILAGIPRRYWVSAAIILLATIAVTVFLIGFWPLALLRQPQPFVEAAHNLWSGLWPFQVPAGIALILLGVSRKKEQMLIAGSPFLSPYAATSSLIGPWMAVSCYLNNWQVILIWLSWWGSIAYRMYKPL